MNAPVLALIGQISQSAIGRGLGHLHEIRDQAGIICAPRRLLRAASASRREAAGLVAEAFRAMRTGRPGPAVLECAIDVWGRSATAPTIAAPSPVPQPPIDEDAVREAGKASRRRQAPVDRRGRRGAGCARRGH